MGVRSITLLEVAKTLHKCFKVSNLMDNNWVSIMFKSVSLVSLFEMFNLAIVQTKTSYNLEKSGNPNLLGNFFIIFDIFNQYCLIILKSPNKNNIYSHTEDALHLLWGLKKWNYTITTTSVSSSAPFCEMTSSSRIFDHLKFVHFSFWFKGWISEFFSDSIGSLSWPLCLNHRHVLHFL